jgi:hypothetical protein
MALELKGLLMPFMLCFERFVVATLERERGKERAGVNHSHAITACLWQHVRQLVCSSGRSSLGSGGGGEEVVRRAAAAKKWRAG